MYRLPGYRFFSLAYRVAVYPGVMQLRVDVELKEEEEKQKAFQPETQQTPELSKVPRRASDKKEVTLAAAAVNYPDLFEFGKA